MSLSGKTTLALELAGGTWLLEGLEAGLIGRLAQSLADPPAAPVAGRVSWCWLAEPGGRPLLDSRNEFDMDFDYREAHIEVRGPRFNALIHLEPVITAEVELLHSARPYMPAIAENVMRILLAYRIACDGGILLHSACFGDTSRAWVVFGHSGAGKSTCSEFAEAAGFGVLSDDMNALFPGAEGWKVRRVPFAGTFQGTYGGPADLPLVSVNLLRQSDTLRLDELSPAVGAAAVLASAAFVNEDPWRSDRLLANCAHLIAKVPVNTLYFRRDPEFLKLLTRESDVQAVA